MRRITTSPGRPLTRLFLLMLLVWPGAALAGIAEEADDGTSIEGCVGCHGAGQARPAVNVADARDVHYVDTDPRGPATASGYRQNNVEISSVDLTGNQVVIEFSAVDENGGVVDNLFAQDGRFAIARLVPGAVTGDPISWHSLLTSERFTTSGGMFDNFGGGFYRYISVFDPTSVPVLAGDTLRVAVQISAGDLPPANAWCDFDASLAVPNGCTDPVTYTRDVVQTATCNGCHGVTSDVKLREHGHRTEVEYCVVCHNPDIGGDGEADMTRMIHRIHFGSSLTMGYPGYEHVTFTRDIDDCTSCHTGGGLDEDNWMVKPNRVACGSCHDDVNFDTGVGHGSGGIQSTNRFCGNCHPADGPRTDAQLPVATVHEGVARAAEAALYRGGSNGVSIDSASYDIDTELITVDYSVTRDGQKMILQSAPEWTSGGQRLAIRLAWDTLDYTNEDSGSNPGQPTSVDALDVGGAITDLGGGNYRAVLEPPEDGNLAVVIEGHPVADIRGDGSFESIPVRDAVAFVTTERRTPVAPRRSVVDIDKCNACHDTAGAGLSLHGNNRSGESQSCVTCHNSRATDINRRPDPGSTLDGKREESIDFKRLIHQIHAGVDLENGVVIYGFGGTPHDFSEVGFIGNLGNCLTCHNPGTYGTDDAFAARPTTVDTGVDAADPSDDLNISPAAAVCSSCHDGEIAKRHMVLNGASFHALESNIAVPEPAGRLLSFAACAILAALARRRRRG